MKKTENLPELRKVVEEKGIWAVSPVVCIATPENDRELAQKARGMSKNTLEVYAKGIRGSGGALPRKSGVLPLFTMSADLTEVADVESLLIVADSEVCWKLKKLKGDGEWNDLMRVLVNLWEEKLALEKPTAVKTVSRHIPSAIRRFVLKRSNYKCEFPGCSKHYSELHHADRFGVTWLHDPDRLFALCKAHHQLK